MRTDVAFDSNILLYLSGDDTRSETAAQLLTEGGVVNPLVLSEVAWVTRRKWRWEWPETTELLGTIRANTVCLPLSCEAQERGMRYAERYQLQVFDAVIVAAAVLGHCTILYSEDMHNGLLIDGLTIRNPFKL